MPASTLPIVSHHNMHFVLPLISQRDFEFDFYLQVAIQLGLTYLIGFFIYAVLSWITGKIVKRTHLHMDELLYQALRGPAKFGIPLICVILVRATTDEGLPIHLPTLDHALQIALIAVGTWAVLGILSAGAKFIRLRNDITLPDNRYARQIHTQVAVIEQTLRVLIIIVGVAMALVTFPKIQHIGAGLLASAGIAGIAMGVAAQPVLGNIIAGIQIAAAQPIRLDDIVVVDNEWGRVEEITLTYVVVKIWDERRLILPFSKFISNSFYNWTRNGSEIMATVILWVDYTASIEKIRAKAKELVEASPLWDKRAFGVDVADFTDHAMKLQILVSGANSGATGGLQSMLREKMITWMQQEMPQALPLERVKKFSDKV